MRPRMAATYMPFSTGEPSDTNTEVSSSGSTCRKTSSATSTPASTPSALGIISASLVRSSGRSELVGS